MTNFSSEGNQHKSFGTPGAILTLILLPPMCFLTIPAIAFAVKAKSRYKKGDFDFSLAFSKKAKRCTAAAWAIAFIIVLTLFAMYSISRLSLI